MRTNCAGSGSCTAVPGGSKQGAAGEIEEAEAAPRPVDGASPVADNVLNGVAPAPVGTRCRVLGQGEDMAAVRPHHYQCSGCQSQAGHPDQQYHRELTVRPSAASAAGGQRFARGAMSASPSRPGVGRTIACLLALALSRPPLAAQEPKLRAVLGDGHAGLPTTLPTALAFSPDEAWLASWGGKGPVRVWDLATGSNTATLADPAAPVGAARFGPRGDVLRLACLDG